MNADSVTAICYLYIFGAVIVSIYAAQILEKRLKERSPHTLPYRWGYYFGCITLSCAPFALLFACAVIIFAASGKAELFGQYLVYTVYFGFQGICGWFIIKRHWWAWIFGTIFSFNILLWIINGIYGRHRRKELSEKSEIRATPTRPEGSTPSFENPAGDSAKESSKPPHPPTYRVARNGVEIGQFGASEFFEAVHSGVIRLDDSVWMKGMVNWMPVSDLLSPPAKDQQMVPSANSIASVSPPKTPVKEKFASIAKVIGGLLFSVLAILVIGLVLIGGAKIAVWVQPWVEGLAALTLGF